MWKNPFSFFCFFLLSFGSLYTKENPLILVSVPPHRYLVKEIAGKDFNVQVIVPQGMSAHTFEPSPRQMMSFTGAKLWFKVGEAFEKKIENALVSGGYGVKVIDLRYGVSLIRGGKHDTHCACSGGEDLHIWTSPKVLIPQVRTVLETLSKNFPEEKGGFEERSQLLLKKLKEADLSLETRLSPLKKRTLFISHPSYAYFARDYGFDQISVEYEGRDPAPQQLTVLLEKMAALHVKYLFVQPEYPSKGARLVAENLGLVVKEVDPYRENFFWTFEEIAVDLEEQDHSK